MNAPWHIQLLGALCAETDGRAVTRFRTRQAGALLARLALFPRRAHAREELIDLLWPDADLEAGRDRLRVALASLRRQLEPPGVSTGSVLAADRAHVRLNPDAVRCDAVEFEATLARAAHASCPDAAECRERAAAIYGGELLPGFYDDWIVEERERLAALADDLFARLAKSAIRPAPVSIPAPAIPASPLGPVTPQTVPKLRGVPLPLSRFFGREGERTRLGALLSDPDVRLVTLTGPGGAGKTRLAIEAARAAAISGPIYWVGLADLGDARLMPDAIAAALSLVSSPGRDPLDLAADALAAGPPALLVLDNLEHLIEQGALWAQSLLARAPSVTLLVTSRRRLALPGECELPVPPLALPPEGGTAEQIAASDSARLFVDRAQAARPDFQVTARNAGDIAALCRDLEGLPLALELAAARAGATGMAEMRRRLAQRFEWLASHKSGGPARHSSLWAALAWSFDLLPPDLQCFFAQLSVFRGGCTVASAQAVCREPQAMEFLTQLRERSLAVVEDGPSDVRFRLLESMREFGAEQLTPGEQSQLRMRHRDFFVAEAEQAEPHLAGAESAVWLAHLGAERDNLRAALDECRSDETTEGAHTGLRLAAALGRFWQARGEATEGRERLGAALGRPEATEQTVVRAWALRWAGVLASFQADYTDAQARAEAALALFGALGAARGCGWARVILGNVMAFQGVRAGSRAEFEEALCLFRECGDERGIGVVLNNLGGLLMGDGDPAGAEPVYMEALAVARAVGDWTTYSLMLGNLGSIAYFRGDLAEARRRLEEARALRAEAGIHDDQPGYVLGMLARVALDEGRLAEARALLVEGMMACHTGRDRRSVGNLLEFWASLRWAEGRPGLGARFLGAAARVLRETGGVREAVEQAGHESDVAQLRSVLGQKTLAAAWAGGEALPWEQAVAEALADDGSDTQKLRAGRAK